MSSNISTTSGRLAPRTHGLDDIKGGGTVQARGDLVTQEETLATDQHFTHRHTLTLTATHTAQQSVTDHRVGAALQTQDLKEQLRAKSSDVPRLLGLVLGTAVHAHVGELERLTDRQGRDVVVHLVNQTHQLDQVNVFSLQARVQNLSADLRLLVILQFTGHGLEERRLAGSRVG
ncbi:hypothetical protein GQ600_15353 [Phytophthora cactorum]|nr:hypothetical protein GQ600_15353 [Phytophthora cactorum]